MRRAAIVETLKDSVQKHFDADVAEVFNLDDLGDFARMIQECDADDAARIDQTVSLIWDVTEDWQKDDLAEGKVGNPNGWLYHKIQDMISG